MTINEGRKTVQKYFNTRCLPLFRNEFKENQVKHKIITAVTLGTVSCDAV